MILQLLNVLIGLSLVFVIFSTIASAVFELIEALRKKRGKLLAGGIKEILGKLETKEQDRKCANQVFCDLGRLYEHPVIYSLYEGTFSESSKGLPSYIPPLRFARAVLMLAEASKSDDAFVKLESYARRQVGQRSLANGETYAQALENEIAAYFNDSMDRLSGKFGRYARRIMFVIGFCIAAFANVDTLQIAQTLSMDPALADRIADQAAEYIEQNRSEAKPKSVAFGQPTEGETTPAQHPPAAPAQQGAEPAAEPAEETLDAKRKTIQDNQALAESLGLPLGWKDGEFDRVCCDWNAVKKLSGFLLTAIALSFGAPFWFDLLNNLVKMRATLKPKPVEEATPEEGPETRPGTAAPTPAPSTAPPVAEAPAAPPAQDDSVIVRTGVQLSGDALDIQEAKK